MKPQPHQQPDLPRVNILENADKSLTVALDGEPQDLPEDYAAALVDPWQPARDLARHLDQCVFAELTDTTGERYTHVFDPETPIHPPEPDRTPQADPFAPAPPLAAIAVPGLAHGQGEPEPAFSICGDGFAPGEDVYIAVVVSTRPARGDGMARLPLPAALLNRLPGVLIMFGLDSKTLIISDPTGAPVAAVLGEHAA
jgi:hypothetical protein